MNRIISCLLGCLSLASVQAQTNQPYFLSNPAISPDGETIVFAFEGDLWKAAVKDGKATRITAMQGYETSPRISPDGQWLAFSSRQKGNADIYIMPMAGGEIKQITFHSANDEVNNWSWDSKKIYFTSNRMGQISGFTVGFLIYPLLVQLTPFL